jgi:exodeoxyribonuclease V gamma subunit
MFHLYQSDKLETLAERLACDLDPPLPPFEPEIILVQSPGMGRWLSLRLAERLGICAHLQFPLPAMFVWDLLRSVFGELPRRSPFSADVLAFRILDWLSRPENLARAPRLGAYLKDGDELRRFQLAARLGAVFDQYLVYRDDWITAWEKGDTLGLEEDERWQALLWRDLAEGQTAPHRAWLMGELLGRIGKAPHPGPLPGGEGMAAASLPLPRRISLFGVSSLPPVFLAVLNRLAERIEVRLYALNPCREFWGEIRDSREMGRLAGERQPEDLYLETGHPLLASLGKQGREFFDSLAECAESEEIFTEEPRRDSLLQHLQADILELVDRQGAERIPIDSADRSLQVHVCHSPMREVEVLRDQLLALFAADPTLKAGDVAVLATDIEAYTPYIEAVFAPSPDSPYVPFGIADLGLTYQNPLLETFLSLLDLPDSRFPADTTLSFLERPAVRRRFGLTEDDLPRIHGWVRSVGARWGRDGDHKAEHGLPPTPRHTWRDGLERLLLGYALPQVLAGDELPLFGGTLPHDEVEGSQALVLGHFAEFLETLFEWAETLKPERPPQDWAELLNRCIDGLFEPDEEDETALLELRGALDLWREFAEQAGFRAPVSLRVVKAWLGERLGRPAGHAGFLTGEVTFCAMVPMRSLPFKVIAVLGLNHDSFPRHHPPPGFDLMARHPRRGDRSRRLDDRYLFLETLLSAREVLYLSYVGRSIRDNSALPPSPLVSELLDVVKQGFVLAEDYPHPSPLPGGEGTTAGIEDHLMTVHPLQPFDPAYFRGAPRLPGYSATWARAAAWIGRGAETSRPLFEAELPEPEEAAWKVVALDDLLRFYVNPARFLLQKRLNLDLETAGHVFEVREPFGLDHFTTLAIREDCLAALLDGRPAEGPALLAEARGLLPHGAFGRRLHAREHATVKQFASALQPYVRDGYRDPLAFCFEIGSSALEGRLARVSPFGLVESVPDRFRPRHTLALWFRHLALCTLKPDGVPLESRLFCLDRTLVLRPVEEPEREWATLLEYFRQGLRRPLPFFVKSAHAYAEAVLKKKSAPEAALKAAHREWDEPEYRSHPHHFGESENAYYRAVYRDTDPLDEAFETLALEVFGEFFAALADE